MRPHTWPQRNGVFGPAWIARVSESKSGRTIYFNGMALRRATGAAGNFYDTATGAEYWVSGVKKRGSNRHWAGSGRILVEAAAVPELLELFGVDTLDPGVYGIAHDIRPTSAAEFVAAENATLHSK